MNLKVYICRLNNFVFGSLGIYLEFKILIIWYWVIILIVLSKIIYICIYVYLIVWYILWIWLNVGYVVMYGIYVYK